MGKTLDDEEEEEEEEKGEDEEEKEGKDDDDDNEEKSNESASPKVHMPFTSGQLTSEIKLFRYQYYYKAAYPPANFLPIRHQKSKTKILKSGAISLSRVTVYTHKIFIQITCFHSVRLP